MLDKRELLWDVFQKEDGRGEKKSQVSSRFEGKAGYCKSTTYSPNHLGS